MHRDDSLDALLISRVEATPGFAKWAKKTGSTAAGAPPKGCNGTGNQIAVNIGYLLKSHNTNKAQSVETIIPAG